MLIEHLFERPDQFLLGFDGSQAVFVGMDRDAYHRSIFCDQRISAANPQMVKIECAELFELCAKESGQPRRMSYIFHVAHCGSTLLSRALDLKDSNIVYREPMALRQISVDYATNYFGGEPTDDWKKMFRLVITLLGRSFEPDSTVIVKGNVPVNFIIPQLMALNSDSRAILLYFSLEKYLLAILRTPGHRQWVAGVSGQLKRGIQAITGATQELTIAQTAACLWLAQISMYSKVISENPNAKSLDAEVLFNSPKLALERAFDFFGQECDESRLNQIVSGELFTRYSKNPEEQFSNESRLARQEAVKKELAGELSEARDWIDQQLEKCPLPKKLGNALAGDAPDLLTRSHD